MDQGLQVPLLQEPEARIAAYLLEAKKMINASEGCVEKGQPSAPFSAAHHLRLTLIRSNPMGISDCG